MAETRDKVKDGIDTAAQGAKRAVDRTADTMQGAQHSAQSTMGNTGSSGSSGGMMDTAKQGISAVADKASAIADKAGDFAGQARDKVRDWAGDAGEGATQAADKVQHWAEDAYAFSGEHLGEFGRECTSLIRRYPVQALLVGFGVGLLLGRASRT
jgi:ElaB/YqjD/DUF883 family membrane-anchored ribosome-binding protein